MQMAAYIAMFELEKDNEPKNYETLLSIIKQLQPGPQFNDPSGPVPSAVFFHSQRDLDHLMMLLREHLHLGDSLVLLRISGGTAALNDEQTREQFRQFLSGM